MNDIEDRLRDAYRCATDTVRPEAIRGLGDHSTGFSPSSRWLARGALHRLLVPLTAAAAVLVIGVAAAVVVPDALHDARRHGNSANVTLAGDPATHFLVGLAKLPDSNYLSVRSAITGAAVATLAAPAGTLFGAAATADGISYVVAVTRPGQCADQLLRFRISRTGRPSRLMGFEPLFLGSQLIEHLAISRNGRTIAFDSRSCVHASGTPGAGPGRPYIGVFTARQISKNTWTGRGRYWSVPGQNLVNSLSLTADGRHIEFSTFRTMASNSNIYLLATNAAQGSAVQRSRVIVRAAAFGAPTTISSSVMTPDGKTIYFATDNTGRAFSGRWALRAVDVASGRSRVITKKPGFGVRIVASPSGRELIAFAQAVPTPVATPSPSPSPTGSRSPVPTVSPSPSPSGSRSPVPTVSPSPAPSSSPAIAPLAAATLEAAFAPVDVIRIELPGGRIRYLNPVPWDVADVFCVW